jgi:hypothetical protein
MVDYVQLDALLNHHRALGSTYTLIAQLANCSRFTVHKRARALGFPKRPPAPKYHPCKLHRTCRWRARRRGV